MCGGNWIGLIGACLTFSRCHIFRFIWYKITAWNKKALKYIKSGDCRRRELKIRLFPVEIFQMKKNWAKRETLGRSMVLGGFELGSGCWKHSASVFKRWWEKLLWLLRWHNPPPFARVRFSLIFFTKLFGGSASSFCFSEIFWKSLVGKRKCGWNPKSPDLKLLTKNAILNLFRH